MFELAVPAMFVAGLATSPHCSLMCGAVQQLHLPRDGRRPLLLELLPLHAGRIVGYALLGAAAGAGGALLTRLLPPTGLGLSLQLIAAVALVALGWRQLRRRVPACCVPRTDAGPWRRFGRGLLWALMPCATLYFALSAVAFSGSSWLGAALLAAFAAGSSPLLAASGWAFAGMGRLQQAPRLAGGLMILVGVTGFAASAAMPAFHGGLWCLP
ncbi:sulfite exporter TauE/SafE family protein [Solimonas flava]|uniref:sulfite exporter TauE/SafE family protein n=1 Tax=Solimonas flava TaxID=415849 RepID=UPI000406F4A6|nr:sulfite exporter TauE/SafE family protein [Solimonas flava]